MAANLQVGRIALVAALTALSILSPIVVTLVRILLYLSLQAGVVSPGYHTGMPWYSTGSRHALTAFRIS